MPSTDKLLEWDSVKERRRLEKPNILRTSWAAKEGRSRLLAWTDGRTSKNKIALLSLSQIGGPDSGGGNGGPNMRTRMP